jgi:2-polyprenyl-6-methoxyphenol hydroxylase-like FAD-dependent oxidoreductase
MGRRAVVIGAGMGGLAAARAAADSFEEVLVLERDELPAGPAWRSGTPQCRHAHVLLAGGLRALDEMLPGFHQALIDAGATKLRTGLSMRAEFPGMDPFPPRDLGWHFLAMSRPLTEFTVRRFVAAVPNIEIRPGCRAQELIGSADGGQVSGVRYEDGDGATHILKAELVIDACGPAPLTLAWLDQAGKPKPRETVVGVDIGYSTTTFAMPDDPPGDWLALATFSFPPEKGRGCFLFPMEGRRWIATLTGRGEDRPPGDFDGWLAYAQTLRTPTLYNAVRNARRLTDVVQYRFPAGVRRHLEAYPGFPRGLLAFGDSLCRFNPIYGQGMSSAALQAARLNHLLAEQAGKEDPFADLAPRFFAAAQSVVDTPWSTATSSDFAFAATKGERPPDFERALQFERALAGLAVRDPEVQDMWQQVLHMLKPLSALQDPALQKRVMDAAAAMA